MNKGEKRSKPQPRSIIDEVVSQTHNTVVERSGWRLRDSMLLSPNSMPLRNVWVGGTFMRKTRECRLAVTLGHRSGGHPGGCWVLPRPDFLNTWVFCLIIIFKFNYSFLEDNWLYLFKFTKNVCNLMLFDISTHLWNHLHNQDKECIHHPKDSLLHLGNPSFPPLPLCWATANLLSDPKD